MELQPGIHKIDGVSGANSFLVIADEGVAVIDTGLPGNEKKIVEYAKKVGVEPGKLRYIILTHPDLDHSGSAAKLKGLTGAKVAIHEADAPRLSGEKKLKVVTGGLACSLR
jgi:glyoxylase-like metal-dependent hydrolase (beta-lactamase superfamily II)